MKQILSLIAAAGITVITLTYALWDVDFALLQESLSTGESWVLVPFLALLTLFYVVNAQRWRLMLRPFGDYSLRQVSPPMMIGFAGNNVLPLRIGELIRAFLFAKEFQQSRSGVLMTLVLERILDLLGILIIYVVGLFFLPAAPTAFRASAWVAAAGISVVFAAIFLFLRRPAFVAKLWLSARASLPETIVERGNIYIDQFDKGLHCLRSRGTTAALLAHSLLRWMLAAGLVWLSVRGFGTSISLALAMLVVGITAFAVSLPSAPGFVGPIQAAFVLALTPFGIGNEVALAASILFLLAHWIPVTGVGLLLLASRHLSFRRIKQELQETEGS